MILLLLFKILSVFNNMCLYFIFFPHLRTREMFFKYWMKLVLFFYFSYSFPNKLEELGNQEYLHNTGFLLFFVPIYNYCTVLILINSKLRKNNNTIYSIVNFTLFCVKNRKYKSII